MNKNNVLSFVVVAFMAIGMFGAISGIFQMRTYSTTAFETVYLAVFYPIGIFILIKFDTILGLLAKENKQ